MNKLLDWLNKKVLLALDIIIILASLWGLAEQAKHEHDRETGVIG